MKQKRRWWKQSDSPKKSLFRSVETASWRPDNSSIFDRKEELLEEDGSFQQ